MDKILIVDDDEFSAKYIEANLKSVGYDVKTVLSAKNIIEITKNYKPDLILLDIEMPQINGFEVCKILKAEDDLKNVPIIFVTGRSNISDVVSGFKYGAVDYIKKPFKLEEIKIRVETHLQISKLTKKLEKTNKELKNKVLQQVKMISDTQMETIFSLAKLAQSRDDDTGEHLERVQKYCLLIAKKLARKQKYKSIVDKEFIRDIVNASPLHDIGKVGISDLILLKPGRLTPEEFEEMKRHTIIGADTLEQVHKKFGDNSFIEMGKVIARSHHERWDGNGYPDKLKGYEIPLAARIMSIADVYDALATKRVYKDAFPQEKCVQIIKEGKGTQFDPDLVDVFLDIADSFKEVREIVEHKLKLPP